MSEGVHVTNTVNIVAPPPPLFQVMGSVGVVRGVDEDHDVVVQYPTRNRYLCCQHRLLHAHLLASSFLLSSLIKTCPFVYRWTLNPAILKKVSAPSGVEQNLDGVPHPPSLTIPPPPSTLDHTPFTDDLFQVQLSPSDHTPFTLDHTPLM